LFDFVEDDEYDGDLGEDDEERPRILVNYKLTNSTQTVTHPKSGLQKPTVTRKTKEARNNPVPEPKPVHNFKAPTQTSAGKSKTYTT
jgi:hypothetical protein